MLPSIGSFSAVKLPEQNPKAVDITSSRGRLSKQQLWRLISRGAHQESLAANRSPTFGHRHRATKVPQLADALAGHQHIGRLHVQVQHLHLVAVDKSSRHLEKEENYLSDRFETFST